MGGSGTFGTWRTIALKGSFGEIGSETTGDVKRKMRRAVGSHENIVDPRMLASGSQPSC
jgi:hypothetical protein